MATTTNFEEYDFEAVKTILATSAGLQPASLRTLLGPNWVGFFEPNEIILPAPAPSQDQANPTVFVRWAVLYTASPEATFENTDVTREGIVRLAARLQNGTLQGVVIALFKRIREAFRDASGTTELVFFPEQPSEYRQPQAGWDVQELTIRFIGQ